MQASQLYACDEAMDEAGAWNLLEEMQACIQAPSLVVVVLNHEKGE